jgi:hypothetical protein
VGSAVMNTIMRKAGLVAAALILAALLTAATGLPRPAYNECERNTSWSIWNEIDSRQTSDTVGGKTTETQDWSSRSELNSSRGEDLTLNRTHHKNADGSAHSHDDYAYSDPEGKGCHNSDGIPIWGRGKSDDDRDADGNTKRHIEAFEEKNGKCVKYVRDLEWDSKGTLIKDTKSETEVPCGKYILEVSWKGTYTLPNGLITATYGPNTAKIYLEPRGDGTYEGKYESVFDGKVTGECPGTMTAPITFNVTAKEVKFGDQDELEFSVKRSHWFYTMSTGGGICPKGETTGPTVTHTHTFTLPIEDGASETFTSLGPIWTFTLKKR